MFKRTVVVLLTLFSLTLAVMFPMVSIAKGSHVLLKTSKGNIELELDDQNAPVSTKNFVDYVNKGFYNNTIFHRVIPSFMVQGGGFVVAKDGNIKQKAANEPIKNEADNGLSNLRGTVSMARTTDKDSAISQFFINLTDNTFLDHGQSDFGYAVFGKVIKGMDVVDIISQVSTKDIGYHQNVPKQPVRILSAIALP